jgi:hypothetical protein
LNNSNKKHLGFKPIQATKVLELYVFSPVSHILLRRAPFSLDNNRINRQRFFFVNPRQFNIKFPHIPKIKRYVNFCPAKSPISIIEVFSAITSPSCASMKLISFLFLPVPPILFILSQNTFPAPAMIIF